MIATRTIIIASLLLLAASFCLAVDDGSIRLAYNAALAEAKRDGSFVTEQPLGLTGTAFIPLDCLPAEELHPYPPRTAGSDIDRVLTAGLVVMNVVEYELDPYTLESYAFAQHLTDKIAAHYEVVALELEMSNFESSPASLTALYNGEGDMAGPYFSADAPFSLGTNAPINRQVVFDASCAWVDGLASFVALASSNFSSFADLQASTGLTTATSGAGSQALFQSVFPNFTVMLNSSWTTPDFVSMLEEGTIDFLASSPEEFAVYGLDVEGFEFFTGGFNGPAGLLHRKVRASEPTECPETTTEINFNFAGLLQR